MRAPTSTLELIDLVRKSGIHPAARLDDQLRTFPNLPVDPTQTAAMLVKQGMLTKFQAKLLLTGRYRGFKLGSYIVSEQIGQGGMGAVYLAEHETLKRRVALKVLPPAKNDPNAKLNVERFLREARSVAALDHPNIVRIHDVGHQGDVHFLVMEYVDGQSLEDVLKKGGPVTPSRAVEYVAQAAAGLQHAHEKGFIHRDIKPANLMLCKDGTVKILDMGLARSSTNESDKLTERLDEGAIVGTADFISPEQAMNLPGIDIRTDIYSLGATFFALVTGTPPFSGNTTQKLVQHQMKDAPSLTTIDRTFPPELAKVVAKMLHKKPEKRYQSPGEVISAVAEWLPNAGAQRMVVSLSGTDLAHSVEMQATLSEIASGGTQRISKSRRLAALQGRTPWALYGGVGAAVAAAVVLVCWMTFGGSTPKDQPAANNAGTPVPQPNPNPNPNPNPPPNPNPVKVNAVGPAAAKVVQRFEAADLQPFRVQIQYHTVKDGEVGALPAGWECQVYDKDATGEFRVQDLDGSKVFAIGCTDGKGSSQLVYRPDRIGQKSFAAGRTYEIRSEYKCDADVTGYNMAQAVGEWKTLNSAKLSSDGWQWASNRFTVPAGADVQLAFGSTTTAPGKFLYIRRVEIVETNDPPLVATGKVLFKLDLAKQQPFLEGGTLVAGANGQRDWKIGQKTGPGIWPTGWYGRPWRELDEAEFFAEAADGRTALGSRNTKGLGSSMIYSPEINGLGGYCRMELEYRTDSKIKPGGHLRFLPNAPLKGKAFDLKKLDPTNGGWKTVTFDLDFKGSTSGRVEFHNAETGPGGELRIRAFTLTAATPTAPVAAGSGKELFRLDAADVPAFRAVKQGPQTVEGTPGAFPKGTYLQGHKVETLAEVARETVDGVAAFRIVHRNEVQSAQLGFELDNQAGGMNLPLLVDQTYVLRVTYKTTGSARGSTYFQEHGTWFQLKQLDLEESVTWKTVDYEVKKTEKPMRVVIDLVGHGLGNALYIREVVFAEKRAVAAANPDVKAKPMVEDAAVKVIDFGPVKPFRATFMDLKSDFDLAAALPKGIDLNCWKAESVAEFRAEEVAGKVGVGVTNLNEVKSSQFNMNDLNLLVPGRSYRVRVQYLTKNEAAGQLFVRKPKHNYEFIQTLHLPRTNGEWKTAAVDFVCPEAGIDVDSQTINHAVGEGNTLYVHKIEIVGLKEGAAPPPPVGRTPPAAAPADGTNVYAVDFVDKPPFVYTIQDKKPSVETWKVLPAGVKGMCWKPESVAEYRGTTVNGKMAVGVTNLNDTISSQLQFAFGEQAGDKIVADKTYRLKLEYLTSNDAVGSMSVRTPKVKFMRLVQVDLPTTAATWKTATLDFVAPAGTPVDLIVENTTTGAGNTLHVAKLEVLEVK